MFLGKGKAKKANKKTMSLVNFLAEETSAPQGFNVVNTRKIDWADSIDEDLDGIQTLSHLNYQWITQTIFYTFLYLKTHSLLTSNEPIIQKYYYPPLRRPPADRTSI